MAAPSPSAILYAAKSTEDEHGSIPTQLDDCRQKAEAEGFEIVEEYSDEAASAWKGNRGPDLEAALDHAERIGGRLYAQHSDRLARGDGRQARHLLELCLRAIKGGFKLCSVQDPQTFENLVMAAVMGERNTEDSRRKSLAVKAGRRRAWERGELPGAPTPDGYERVGDELRQDPERREIILLAGDLADQGCGDPSIARELNRRGYRTKGGKAWFRRRVQDLLSNHIYYGGITWHRGLPDEEVNWDTSFPAYWTRDDFKRRRRDVAGRDLAQGSDRRPKGPPHRNHALAGLARCGECGDIMRPVTSTYRRKDGTRKRTYNCRHIQDGTGLCDAPPVDAELIDKHVVDELQRYLGDFEAWRDQITSGYATERQRLERELSTAVDSREEQERTCERIDRLAAVASTDAEAKAALRIAASTQEELERCQRRFEAARDALRDVPDEAPADAMLDFYNELSAAVRGRLDGANTIARVNDALRDIFFGFTLLSPPHHFSGGQISDQGIMILPQLRRDRAPHAPDVAYVTEGSWREFRMVNDEEETPPLRTIEAPSAQLADSQL